MNRQQLRQITRSVQKDVYKLRNGTITASESKTLSARIGILREHGLLPLARKRNMWQRFWDYLNSMRGDPIGYRIRS